MCKAPKPPEQKEPKKVEFLRNRYLDEFVGDAAAVRSLKTGRSSLRNPLVGTPAVASASQADLSLSTPVGGTNVATPRGDFRPRGIAPRGANRQLR